MTGTYVTTYQSTNITFHLQQHYHDTMQTPILHLYGSLVSPCLTGMCSLYHYNLMLILTLFLFYKCHHMNRNLPHCIPRNQVPAHKVLAFLHLHFLSEIQHLPLYFSV